MKVHLIYIRPTEDIELNGPDMVIVGELQNRHIEEAQKRARHDAGVTLREDLAMAEEFDDPESKKEAEDELKILDRAAWSLDADGETWALRDSGDGTWALVVVRTHDAAD